MKSLVKNFFILLAMGLPFSGFAQNEWIGQLSLSDFDCDNHTACYQLGIKGINEDPWALGDQNYRFFFDANNLSITGITSLLPAALYSQIQTDEILEIVGQNQESFSPLDNIDENLGFLDFNIVAYSKQFPNIAKQISNQTFTPIAEICLEVSADLMENVGEEYATNILFSRPLTAGQITNQYSVISEIDAPNHTKATNGIGFLDVTYNAGLDAQLGQICQLLNDNDEILLNQDRMTLFPNPYVIGETLNYQSEFMSQSIHEITIYDSNSRVIETFQELPVGNTAIKISKSLAAGVYLFHIKSDKHQFLEELIVIQK